MNRSTSWHGKVNLSYGSRDNQTVVRRCLTAAPFRVQRPFYPDGDHVCHTVLLHTAGGVVGGDRLSIDLALAENSHVFLTTAAANKIYRSNGEVAAQTGVINQAAGTILEYFPQELIVFDGADYRQSLRVNLAPGAVWCGSDIIRFGRTARGEKYHSGQWCNATEVWQEGELLWGDRQQLQGNPQLFSAWNGLNDQPIVGTLALVGLDIHEEKISQLREIAPPLKQGLGGITKLPKGLLCRYRGSSSTEVKRWFIAMLQAWRSLYSPHKFTTPRVWQTY
ncbi:urease accessory protein UreD [[Limnothrix rosea] IAM M-220]|uniref:urease accessory protein UreD n=1 Tax=[Limnothrix rosea] IAM M-220 TaxID=454133 RepID=UPI00095E5F23|nr:urease accessory protein UreD [[Limnothrix rosea] IAM M-220]OKH12141.1 urease accessory protein [[Limnothrix rosea] IAM M-220]